MKSHTEDNGGNYLILYDGVCALCNAVVKFVLKRDRQGQFLFAPLQGETARGLGISAGEPPETVMLVFPYPQGDNRLGESDAVIKIARLLGGIWRLATLACVIPRPIRDWLYRWVARHRYRWFGKYDTCPLPPVNQKDRFLL